MQARDVKGALKDYLHARHGYSPKLKDIKVINIMADRAICEDPSGQRYTVRVSYIVATTPREGV